MPIRHIPLPTEYAVAPPASRQPYNPAVFTVATDNEREFYEAVYWGANFGIGERRAHVEYIVTPDHCSESQYADILDMRLRAGLTSDYDTRGLTWAEPMGRPTRRRHKHAREPVEPLPLPG